MDYIFYFIFLLVLSLVENPRIFNITAHIELRKKIKNEELRMTKALTSCFMCICI